MDNLVETVFAQEERGEATIVRTPHEPVELWSTKVKVDHEDPQPGGGEHRCEVCHRRALSVTRPGTGDLDRGHGPFQAGEAQRRAQRAVGLGHTGGRVGQGGDVKLAGDGAGCIHRDHTEHRHPGSHPKLLGSLEPLGQPPACQDQGAAGPEAEQQAEDHGGCQCRPGRFGGKPRGVNHLDAPLGQERCLVLQCPEVKDVLAALGVKVGELGTHLGVGPKGTPGGDQLQHGQLLFDPSQPGAKELLGLQVAPQLLGRLHLGEHLEVGRSDLNGTFGRVTLAGDPQRRTFPVESPKGHRGRGPDPLNHEVLSGIAFENVELCPQEALADLVVLHLARPRRLHGEKDRIGAKRRGQHK